MFIAALFTVVKTWKQLKYPSNDDWIKKMQYLYTVYVYSAIRKDEILPFVTIWRFLKKLGTELSYDPAIPLLGIYQKT